MTVEETKQLILDEIGKTETRIIGYKEMTQPIGPDNAIGRVSRMDAIVNSSVVEATLRQAEAKLEGLKTALAKAGSPDFGICAKCKKEIPVRRILIRPESPYCVNCSV